MNKTTAIVHREKIPANVIGALPTSVIAAIVVTYLSELGRGAMEGELWEGIDPERGLSWETRRTIMTKLLLEERIEREERHTPKFPDIHIRIYKLPTSLSKPAPKDLFNQRIDK